MGSSPLFFFLDLDNGNVPGSESDDDADEYEELPGN